MELFVHVALFVYITFDIFMITFYGNEIKLHSDKLTYRLYESNWIDRSESIKKNVKIFGEFLMEPQTLIVLKLYPLTLETFTEVRLLFILNDRLLVDNFSLDS